MGTRLEVGTIWKSGQFDVPPKKEPSTKEDLRIVSGIDILIKVIYPKFFKQWLSTVAHTIDRVCSKILNQGLNHGLLFSLFKFFG